MPIVFTAPSAPVPLLSAPSFVQAFDVSSEESNTQAVKFSPDGINMFIIGYSTDLVRGYVLSTPWDISTAGIGSPENIFNVGGQETIPLEVTFSPDGLRMYVCGVSDTDIHQYSLLPAWDVTSASFVQTYVTSVDGLPNGVNFKPDGTRMYITGNSNNTVFGFYLSTPWDVSTAAVGSPVDNLVVTTEETNPTGAEFTADGKTLLVSGLTEVNEYSLSTAWMISSASHVQSYAHGRPSSATGVTLKPDNAKMYLSGESANSVYEFNL